MMIKHSKRTVRKPCRYCQRKDLYWAHDTDQPGEGRDCDQCGVNGKWVMVEMDGVTLHSERCTRKRNGTGEDVDQSPETGEKIDVWLDEKVWQEVTGFQSEAKTPETANPVVPTGDTSGDAYAAFQLLMDAMSPKVDRADVVSIVKDEINRIVFPTRTVVERANGETVKIENTHEKLSDVIMDLAAGEHVLMVGSAGTGKSTIAEQAAEALSTSYYSISLSPMTPASQILGYMQAEGQYVRSLYREAYENGGVFHFDEFDNAHPSVLAVINASLANGQMAFPDEMIHRHPDFRCVASANTYGRGPDRQYVGRQQIDAATLDRFTVETIEVDEALEAELCKATGADDDTIDRVLKYVRMLRLNAEVKGMAVVMSPRASIGMCRLLAAGKSWQSAVAARVRRGMSDQDWSKLTTS